VTTLPEIEGQLREVLDGMPKPVRAELLRILLLPDFDRASAIGDLWAHPRTRGLAELLIDAEEDRPTRALLVTMLREAQAR
jgi:hypothetical protein